MFRGLLSLLLVITECAPLRPPIRATPPPFQDAALDVVLYGATSNLAAKYLWQSLLHLHAATGGAVRVHAVAREALSAAEPRVRAGALRNTTCGLPASSRCVSAREAFLTSISIASTADDAGVAALGATLEASSMRRGWLGRVIYFATASDVVPSLLSSLGKHVNLRTRSTRVVVEKPVGSDRATAAALVSTLRTQLANGGDSGVLLLVDHFLAKAGIQLIPGARAALGAHSPAWRDALSSPLHTEVFGLESDDCEGRASYYNTAGAVRDMLVTHLTLAAAASLQALTTGSFSLAARAGVLAHLTPLRSRGGESVIAVGSYAGAREHGLDGRGLVTAAGAAFHSPAAAAGESGIHSGGSTVLIASAKATGRRSTFVRQVLRLARGGGGGGSGSTPSSRAALGDPLPQLSAAEAASAARCGPLSVTFHVQGERIAPHPRLAAAVEALRLPQGAPSVLFTGLCGTVGAALGSPAPLMGAWNVPPPSVGTPPWRWVVRTDADAGLWAAALDVRAWTVDDALDRATAASAAATVADESIIGGSPPADLGPLLRELLASIARAPAASGGDAYTASIAAALAGAAGAGSSDLFLSEDETDRLWQLWAEPVEAADAAIRGLEFYATGAPPPWLQLSLGDTTLGRSHDEGEPQNSEL